MESKKAKQIVQVYSELQKQRQPLEIYWRDAYRFTNPKRGMAFSTKNSDGITNATSARTQQAALLDSTSIEAVMLLAASMLEGLTPSNSSWLQLGTTDADDEDIPFELREWLEESAERMMIHIHTKSNYNAIAMEYMTDIAIAGMSGLYIEFDTETRNLYFEQWPLDSLYCQSSVSKELIDSVYRMFRYTGSEAAHKFGFTNLPDYIQKDIKTNPSSLKTYEFIHTIRPRIKESGKQSQGKFKKTMPFESVYVEVKTKAAVKEDGFRYFPVIIPRFELIPGTDYAVGQLDKALPDIKMLNKTIELNIKAKEIDLYPPMMVEDDAVLNPSTLRIGPNRIIPVSNINGLKPLATGANHRLSIEEINRLQNQIKRVMMADMLQPLEKQNMTATEVATRTQLVRKVLGPVYSRTESEFQIPLVTIVFNLLFENGMLGQLPQGLENISIKPIFQSPQARAQRMDEVTAMLQFEDSMRNTIGLDPAVIDNYDLDKSTQKKAMMFGVPVDVMRDDRKVKQIREQRQAQQQQQALMEQQQNGQ